jgi:hypothetical protein
MPRIADDADLSNKMANTINASARLRKTYTPVNVESVRRVDEARQRGRTAIKKSGHQTGSLHRCRLDCRSGHYLEYLNAPPGDGAFQWLRFSTLNG